MGEELAANLFFPISLLNNNSSYQKYIDLL